MEVLYVTLTSVSLGFELCVCMSCTFCCIFGKGLALRGPYGARSVHTAVDNLQKQQKQIFGQFVTGIVAYLCSHILQMWIYFRPRVALTVSVPLVIFVVTIVYYVWYIVGALLLDDSHALTGQIGSLRHYDRIEDLDEAIYKPIESKQMLYKRGHP
eukprot:SRR837773.27178.p1 GENE.SRR837773.27178~~SRR837773.27178.p1  ORF type:complete len:176 (+),score=33.73 SRR837773.27178:63-530(+)